MKKINEYYAPNATEIKNAIKSARRYAKNTGNHVQLWFSAVDGKFHREEFVDSNSWVCLPKYCFNISLLYENETETAETIKNYLKDSEA